MLAVFRMSLKLNDKSLHLATSKGTKQNASTYLMQYRNAPLMQDQYSTVPSPEVMTSLKDAPPGIIGSTCSTCGTMTSSKYGPGVSNISLQKFTNIL